MAIKKYLQHYAEPESDLGNFNFRYDNALVIPAYNESDDFLYSLNKLQTCSKFLLILIINQPEESSVCEGNEKLEKHLQERFSILWQHSQQAITLFQNDHFDILRVDRFQAGAKIPVKQGVGLARKIGADIACQLISQQQICSPWIFTTDADAELPDNYFSSISQQSAAALIYPHQHISPNGKTLPLTSQLYDLSLDYYVSGLQWADSPYAFHTIGSCIAIHYKNYAQVRGFPKRSAGEDFYLLNKIRKVGAVVNIESEDIKLLARESDRVPFGTGPALRKINLLKQAENEFLLYHPWLFHYLKYWLKVITRIWSLLSEHVNLDVLLSKEIEKSCRGNQLEPNIFEEVIATLECKKAIQSAITHSSSEAIFLKHMMNWFDGFKTLKFLHYIRDRHLPSLPWSEVMAVNSFLNNELFLANNGAMMDAQALKSHLKP